MLSRRTLLGAAASLPILTGARAALAATTGLTPITGGAKPISVEERNARIAKLQRLMRARKIGALLVESGSSLEYFTGVKWRRSERTTAAVIPAKGEIVLVVPAFEEPSVRESRKRGFCTLSGRA